MKLVFYDGELTDIQHYITTEFNGYFGTLDGKKASISTIDAGKGIHNVLKRFDQIANYLDIFDTQVVVTNSPDLLNKVDCKNIYLFKDGMLKPLYQLTTRHLKPTLNIRKLYLSGEFNMDMAKITDGRKPRYEASGWPYESINPEYNLNKDSKHTYTSTDVPARYYFVIHKLREKEQYKEDELIQFVTAVDKEEIAKDICDRYTKSARYAGFKLVYEKVYLE